LVADIVVEGGKILDEGKSSGIGDNRLEHNERVMLPDVVICKCFLIGEVVASIASIRRVLLVLSPRYALCVQQVCHGGYVARHRDEAVGVHAKMVSRNGSSIIRLRRMSGCPVIGQRDALRRKEPVIGVSSTVQY
jgi:hypothetical protein